MIGHTSHGLPPHLIAVDRRALPRRFCCSGGIQRTFREAIAEKEALLHSSMIGKIEKAHRYAEERARFEFQSMVVTVHGNNSDHTVHYDGERWSCDCDYYQQQRTCAHTMSLEVMLEGTVVHHDRSRVAVA